MIFVFGHLSIIVF